MNEQRSSVGRRRVLQAAATLPLLATPALRGAAAQAKPIRIGVLTDMSSWGRDNGGPGSVYAANAAAEAFGGEVAGRKVEILVGDHQMSTDVGMSIARKWIDEAGVDAIADVPNSAIAFGISGLCKEKNRIALLSGAGSSELTNARCNDRTVQFTYNTYATAKVTANALAAQGARTWFFITADYAFGKQLEQDATRFILEGGGKVLGHALHPTGSSDFSSLLLQAQASHADVVALANSGHDCTNALKQAVEFGISKGGQRVAALAMFLTDANAAGLQVAQGTLYATSAYWDMTPATKQWSQGYFAKVGMMPTMLQIGVYGVVLHYLKAAKAAGSIEAAALMAKMQELPIDDPFVHNAHLRADGQVIRDMYLARVKTPQQSKYPWDYLEIVKTVPGAEAFRPASESACPLLKKA
ncbi:MAG: ABC transporter substrate-binding protein [Rhodospirillales bacterium]|nr:ABC transporter substrate-binding protein [Rhodospirillales bacterium]